MERSVLFEMLVEAYIKGARLFTTEAKLKDTYYEVLEKARANAREQVALHIEIRVREV